MRVPLDKDRVKVLLEHARSCIEQRLQGDHASTPSPALKDLYKPSATFVTLKIDGHLRGCIGNLEAVSPLWESVGENAVNAAFHDSRFAPLTAEEFVRMDIDISVLTEPVPLEYEDAADLQGKLRPGRDGVVLHHGNAGATFLPQVWQQLPTVDQFLDQLCVKAGLPKRCWRDDHPDILTYQVQHLSEEGS